MITLEDAKARVTALVEANPEYVYEKPGATFGHGGTCVYFGPDNKPSCLVGQAYADELRVAGIGWDRALNESGVTEIFGRGEHHSLPAEDDAILFLTNVQDLQDCGRPWGEALNITLTSPRWDRIDEFGNLRLAESYA